MQRFPLFIPPIWTVCVPWGQSCAFLAAGDALPPCDAIWLPGGYPELHARALHENRQLRDGIAQHMAQGKPVWAECGGMALCDG
jgi:cobyrinic acid a,c-diamide synthase